MWVNVLLFIKNLCANIQSGWINLIFILNMVLTNFDPVHDVRPRWTRTMSLAVLGDELPNPHQHWNPKHRRLKSPAKWPLLSRAAAQAPASVNKIKQFIKILIYIYGEWIYETHQKHNGNLYCLFYQKLKQFCHL